MAIECPIEYRNARVGEGVVIVMITMRAIGSIIVRWAIGSAIIAGIIAMVEIVMGIIATPAIVITIINTVTRRTKRGLNVAEFIHVPLTDH